MVGTGVGGSGGSVKGGGRGVEVWAGGSGAAVGVFVINMGGSLPVVTLRATAAAPGLGLAPPSSTGPSPPWLALVLRTTFSRCTS